MIKRFIDVKSGGQLSEKTIPKNRCQGPAKLKEAAHLDTDYCCSFYTSYISYIFSQRRIVIYLAPFITIIYKSTAYFSLSNTKVLSLSATAPIFSIIYLQYLIKNPRINYCPHSYSIRFPIATALAK